MSQQLFIKDNLESVSRSIRTSILRMCHRAKTPHIGGSLSCVEILVCLYWKILKILPEEGIADHESRDRVILSKGHCCAALYAVLAERNIISPKMLLEFSEDGSPLSEQPTAGEVLGVEFATGSLGHGLSAGIGMAISCRMTGNNFRVYVVLGDGECNEGAIWEAAMFASSKEIDNLCAIIDYNKWQGTGRTNSILKMDPLKAKFQSFGWATAEVDGHDINELAKEISRNIGKGKPLCIIAHTIKGKGVSFMEDDNNWHYKTLNEENLFSAVMEIEKRNYA